MDPRAPKSPTVTLVLTPEDAQKLELAKNQGKIGLSLRNPLDSAQNANTGPHDHRSARPHDQRAHGPRPPRADHEYLPRQPGRPQRVAGTDRREEARRPAQGWPRKKRAARRPSRRSRRWWWMSTAATSTSRNRFDENCAMKLSVRGTPRRRLLRARTDHQSRPAHDITLVEGRGELLTFQQRHHQGRDLRAQDRRRGGDFAARSDGERQGPGPHHAGRSGRPARNPARYEIDVTKDTTEWDSFTKSINDSAGAPITVTGTAKPSC